MSPEGKKRHSGFTLYLNPNRSAIEAELLEFVSKIGSKQMVIRDLLILGYLVSKQGVRIDPLTRSSIASIQPATVPVPVQSGPSGAHGKAMEAGVVERRSSAALETPEAEARASGPDVEAGSAGVKNEKGLKEKFRNLM